MNICAYHMCIIFKPNTHSIFYLIYFVTICVYLHLYILYYSCFHCDFSLYQSLPNRDRFKFLRCEGGGIDVMLAYMLGRHIYVPFCVFIYRGRKFSKHIVCVYNVLNIKTYSTLPLNLSFIPLGASLSFVL